MTFFLYQSQKLTMSSRLVELVKNYIVFYRQTGFSIIVNTCVKLGDSVTDLERSSPGILVWAPKS